MIRRVAVSCRVVNNSAYPEARDALSHDWLQFFARHDIVPFMVPNVSVDVPTFLSASAVTAICLTSGNNVGRLPSEPQDLNIDDVSPERDAVEHALLSYATDNRVPVLGVCRGLQMMNVYWGGELARDVDMVTGTTNGHVATHHTVHIGRDWSAEMAGKAWCCNSYHRQGVTPDTIAGPLQAFAATDDGLVEGIWHPELPMTAIQWHPERSGASAELDTWIVNHWLSGAAR